MPTQPYVPPTTIDQGPVGPLPDRADGAPGRRRLLMLAYACGPGHGSETGIGWHRAVQAARFHDTTVLCEEHEFSGPIRDWLKRHGRIPGLTFRFVPKLRWESRLGRIPGCYYASYYLWQRRAFQVARALHAEWPFDLVHHVNFIGYREPGLLWRLGIPFVWGPWGGTQNYPWAFLSELPPIPATLEALRTIANHWQLATSRRVRRAARAATVRLAANRENQQRFTRSVGVACETMPDVGFSGTPAAPRAGLADPDRLRLLWCGTLCPRKALFLLLRALPILKTNRSVQLRIVGDGEQRRRWQRLARQLQVDDCIEWLGQVPHDEARRQFEWADVFVFTSLRDTTGTVLMEALAAALPIVCLDHQGGRDLAAAGGAVAVPVQTVPQVVTDLSCEIDRLADDNQHYRARSRAAAELAGRFGWCEQGEQMAAIYRRALAANASTGRPV